MKQRMISGVIAAFLFALALTFRDSIGFNIAISILSIIAIWEIFVATKYMNNKLLLTVCMIFAGCVPFFRNPYFTIARNTACFIFVLLIFSVMLYERKTITLEQIGLIFMLVLIIPFAFSSLIYLKDLPSELNSRNYMAKDGLFFVLLAAFGAWVTDMGAYFVGKFFGKHKLAPTISPKKTIEGAAGGVVLNLVVYIIAGFIWQAMVVDGHGGVQIIPLAFVAILASLIAMLGDLSASFIKRSCHIKDFGNIMPGHGGVLDRFDSILLVAPFLYIVLQYIPIIERF
ncbi:MAG: hypothetical protein BGN88_14850 [Clostridiales bacterium 43-6]|nr:MAG: hypothetical protein BGN88_14850 [Clostridiales bacterium 43-6]